jgi:hypothetical protein
MIEARLRWLRGHFSIVRGMRDRILGPAFRSNAVKRPNSTISRVGFQYAERCLRCGERVQSDASHNSLTL